MKFVAKTYLWLAALPYALILLGAMSNQAVLISNGGKFPVQLNEVRVAQYSPVGGMIDRIHCVMTDSTHLNALADIFTFHSGTESIGDLAIDLGESVQPFTFGAWLALIVRKLRCS